MESVHELAAVETDSAGTHLVLFQAPQITTVRCPSCKGLRAVATRHVTRGRQICEDCIKGNVVRRTQFHNYWLQRYTMDEIHEMARAIWG